MAEVDEIGARLGGTSYGVVTSAELAAAGVDPSVVNRLVARGRWTRLWRGVYLTASHARGRRCSPTRPSSTPASSPAAAARRRNATLSLHGRFVGIADGYLAGTGVGGEMDSKEVHGDADALDDTLVRHGTFTDAGLTLEHVTPGRYPPSAGEPGRAGGSARAHAPARAPTSCCR